MSTNTLKQGDRVRVKQDRGVFTKYKKSRSGTVVSVRCNPCATVHWDGTARTSAESIHHTFLEVLDA